MANKKWYLSRQLWVNVIAIVGVIIVGKEFDVQTVGIALAVVNFGLRLITKKPVEW